MPGGQSTRSRILIGPAVGGLVVGLAGPAWGFGIDAATFGIGRDEAEQVGHCSPKHSRQPSGHEARPSVVPIAGVLSSTYIGHHGSPRPPISNHTP